MTQARKFHFSTSMSCCTKVVCSANSSTIAKFNALLHNSGSLHKTPLLHKWVVFSWANPAGCSYASSNDPFFSTSLLHNPTLADSSTSDHNYYCHSQNTWALASCTKCCQPKRLVTTHSLSIYNMKKGWTISEPKTQLSAAVTCNYNIFK